MLFDSLVGMNQKNKLEFTPDVVLVPLFLVLSLWVVFWWETRFGFRATHFGIYPRTGVGLKGILFGPFVHGSLEHLFNNSIPLFVLTTAVFYFYRAIRWKILFFGVILTGLGTWLFARPAWHIGASGLVYVLVSFLFFKGIFSKQFQLTALSLLVVFLYGGMLWYLFPIDPRISWEGHVSGFFVGLVFALFFRKNPVENKKYEWEKPSFQPENDPFMKHFDDDGNFIELPKPSEVVPSTNPPTSVRVVYEYKPRTKNEEE